MEHLGYVSTAGEGAIPTVSDPVAPFDRPLLGRPWRLSPDSLGATRRPSPAPLEVEIPETLKPVDEEDADDGEAQVALVLGALMDAEDRARDLRMGNLAQRCEGLEARLAEVTSRLEEVSRSAAAETERRVAEALADERRSGTRREREAAARARTEAQHEFQERLREAEGSARDLRAELNGARESLGRLEAQVAELREAGEALERERAEREGSERAHASEVSRLENEVRRLNAELAAERSREPELDLTRVVGGPLDVIRTIPQSLVEEVRLFSTLQDRVEFLPSALESAARYHGGDLDRYWEGLLAMHDVMWPLRLQETDVHIGREFRERTGFEYAPNESRETLEIEACRKARTFRYRGEDRLMTNHVKVGNPGNYADGALRIYFLLDRERAKLVVGHIGRHLPTKTWLRST